MASQVRWIRALADRPDIDDVRVLTRRLGHADLPANVAVHVFGKDVGFKRALSFTAAVRRLPPDDVDFYLISRRGPYPALLLPWKLAYRSGVYHWKAHPRSSPLLRFYARWCDDLVFTSTSRSFPLDLPKVKVVGHGIDTQLFRPEASAGAEPAGDLLMVGRIAPVKHIDRAVRIVAECRSRYGVTPTLDVVGRCDPADAEHARHLEALVADLGLDGSVRFRGEVPYEEMPGLLGRYRAVLNLAGTALDKSALEAMAVGVPVLTTNECTVEVLPEDLLAVLSADAQDIGGQAARVHDVLAWPETRRAEVGARLSRLVVEHHSLDSLFDNILHEIRVHIDGPARH